MKFIRSYWMKFVLNVIHVLNVKNPAKYILDLAVAADRAGWDGYPERLSG